MIRSIIIASLSIPVLIFMVFSGSGIFILFYGLFNGNSYNSGWLGMVYAGSIYSYFAVLISSIPTLILGLPAGLLAQKYKVLNKNIILLGSPLLGSLYLSLLVVLYITPFNMDIFGWAMLVGAVGGLFHGYIFLSCLKSNKVIQHISNKHPG